MNDDATLLHRFAEEKSEAAFTELVQRHFDLVYGAALRRTGGDTHWAADVAQQVFTALARQARELSRHPALSAWLHTATRNLAVNLVTAEHRRKNRELTAVAMEAPLRAADEPPLDWEAVRPVIDAAIDGLPEADRAAVVLRFLERRSFADIGASLSISTDAARMRTERALEKLRGVLARRGITSTAAALGVLVSAQAKVNAPFGLAAEVAAGAVGATASNAVMGTVGSFLVNTKTIIAVSCIAVALGLVLYVRSARNRPPASLPVEASRSASTPMTARAKREVQETNPAAGLSSSTQVAPTAPASVTTEQKRAILAKVREIAAARDEFHLDHGRDAASLAELVEAYIHRLNPIAGESYDRVDLKAGEPVAATLPDGTTVTYDPSDRTTTRIEGEAPPRAPTAKQKMLLDRFGSEFIERVTQASRKAGYAYHAAHNGQNPRSPEEVLPYFESPQLAADWTAWRAAIDAIDAGK